MQNWEYKKIQDVCSVYAGQGAPQGEDKYCSEGTPFIKAGNLIELLTDKSEFDIQQVSPDIAKQYKLKLYKAGSVLFAKSGMSCMKGHVYTLQNDAYVVSHLAILTPFGIESSFLNYYFQYIKSYSLVKDAAYPTISMEDINNCQIPLPPLEEQKRIVKILDEKFAMLETVKANAKANLQNAKDLFQSQLTKAFSNTTWEKKRLGDVCLQKQNKKWKDEQVNTEYQYIDLSAVDRESNLVTEIQTITKDSAPSRAQQIVKDGDVLFGTTRPTLKRVCLLNDDYDEQICSTGFCVIRANRDVVTPDWLFYQFFNDAFYKYIEPLQKGANYPAVTDKDVMNFEIHLPPLSEQKRIVEQLDSLSEKVRSLEEIYTKQLANCDELKQAFLAKAFAGEL